MQSISSYQSALDNLGQRKGHEDIWDAVVWELSTALYNMAVLAVESPAPHIKVIMKPILTFTHKINCLFLFCRLI